MLNARQCVLYSGGAAGTEQFFGALAEGWGIEEVNYSFEGHQIERKRGVRVLTSEELALKDVSLAYVSKLMNREYTRAPLFRKVLQSICWQVRICRNLISSVIRSVPAHTSSQSGMRDRRLHWLRMKIISRVSLPSIKLYSRSYRMTMQKLSS